jgi:hypothetical protein
MNQELRSQLVEQLRGGRAFFTFDQAVADFPMAHINTRPPNVPYTFWAILEHMRIAQLDILDYIPGTHYKPLAWPADYWPALDREVTPDIWQETINQFKADLEALVAIVRNPATDLTAPLPHAPQHNTLREILIIADHNAYHTGEFAILRQVVGVW